MRCGGLAWLDPNPEEGVAPMRSGWAYPEAEEVERGLPLADDGPADGPAVDCWHGLAWHGRGQTQGSVGLTIGHRVH